jgi:2-O-methyltransferase
MSALKRKPVAPIARDIVFWVQRTFGGSEPKLFLELGANVGQDTAWMSALPNIAIHAFEPDPRSQPAKYRNVTMHRMAIAAHDGTTQFILSSKRSASSIREPLAHLTLYPRIKFHARIEVPCTTLDTFTRNHGIEDIAFQWWDIQGAEVDAINGGRETLARTRYLYTEYCPYRPPWYQGQIGLPEILEMLPGWRIVTQWPQDVLLENMVLNG